MPTICHNAMILHLKLWFTWQSNIEVVKCAQGLTHLTGVPIRNVSLLVWGENRDSEEKGLLNLVTSGGV